MRDANGERAMNRSPWNLALLAAMLATSSATLAASEASTPPVQSVAPAGSQPSAEGPAETFTGRVRIDPVWTADERLNAAGLWVTFEPGARSHWHTHPAGQRLVVVSGVGRVQQWGQPVQEIRPGDVVTCPPGVKHWHGAAPTTAMTHLAVVGVLDGKNVEWMEAVSDAQYDAR
jgi:quercetin dioxygenase-like cupin family protein